MQKTYWWRAGLMVGCLIILAGAYFGPCESNIGRCLGGNSIIMTRTIFHFILSFFIVSPFLFLVGDSVFLKWLRFAIVWFTIAAIFILLAPEYQGGWLGIGPEKESVSIWMSILFVILSFVKIIWESRKAERSQRAV